MGLHFDIGLKQLTVSGGSAYPLSAYRHKRGDTERETLDFWRNTQPAGDLGSGVSIRYVVKATPGPDAVVLAEIADWTEEDGVWTGALNLNGSALSELVGDERQITLLGELTFVSDSEGPISSQFVTIVLENDLWRGTEGTPLALPDPTEWLDVHPALVDTDASPLELVRGGDSRFDVVTRAQTTISSGVILRARAQGGRGNGFAWRVTRDLANNAAFTVAFEDDYLVSLHVAANATNSQITASQLSAALQADDDLNRRVYLFWLLGNPYINTDATDPENDNFLSGGGTILPETIQLGSRENLSRHHVLFKTVNAEGATDELTYDGAVGADDNRIQIGENESVAIDGVVLMRRQHNATKLVRVSALASRGTGSAALVGTPTITTLSNFAGFGTFSVSVTVVGNAFQIALSSDAAAWTSEFKIMRLYGTVTPTGGGGGEGG